MQNPWRWDPLFTKDDPRRGSMILFGPLQFVGHLVRAGLFIHWQVYILLVTVTLGCFSVTFLSRTCVSTQHTGMTREIPDWRLSCHTMEFGPVISFLCWNTSFHLEHHTCPAVPSSNLGKPHRVIANDIPAWERGYVRAAAKIMRLVKRQRRDPE